VTAARRRFRARVQLLVEGPQVDEESIDDFLDSVEPVIRACLDSRKMRDGYMLELVPDSVVADRGTEVKAKE
jgi:hypothetical protein